MEYWTFEGELVPMPGGNAAAGRPPSEWSLDPSRYDEVRAGCWDIDARIRDMDLNGTYASINFPSTMCGFAGQRFSFAKDQDLGMAALRAYNNWHLEGWAGAYPDRIIPCQLTWLNDPIMAAKEIEANAALGFKAVSFPEFPEKLGLPSVHTTHWDPFFAACEATDTVVCLHVGSGSWVATGSSDSVGEVISVLFYVGSNIAVVDWLFSGVPLRFPNLKLAISEGGIGWVPVMMDRIDHCTRFREFTGSLFGPDDDPIDVLKRNFWFCALDDTAGFEMIDRIGVENVMVEVDYPHIDATWPDTQHYLARQLAPLTDEQIRKVTWQNASELFRHPVPDEVLRATVPYVRPDGSSFRHTNIGS
jgi:predicted TIM-barrel fold metal-dependent hydrolase